MNKKLTFLIFARAISVATLTIMCVGFLLAATHNGVIFFEDNRTVLVIEFTMTFLGLIITLWEISCFINEVRRGKITKIIRRRF